MAEPQQDKWAASGLEETGMSYVTIEDPSGDAFRKANHEKFPAVYAVLMLFAIGAGLTMALLWLYIRCERQKKKRREEAKLGISRSPTAAQRRIDTTDSTVRSGFDLATPSTVCSENRSDIIERGVTVHTWYEDVPSSTEEQSDDEESHKTGSSDGNRSCPICRKSFESGVEVCTSRSPNCRHTFHKTCMFNWLQYQSSCPVCNQGYLVH